MTLTFNEFKDKAKKVLNLNLDGYKIKRVERRTDSLMRRHDIEDYDKCLKLLQEDPEFRKRYINHLTINTSEFFRDPENFEHLKKKILPELLEKNKKIKIWSAPCSDGSEPYTIDMILKKLNTKSSRYKILASDLNTEILETANKAVYKEKFVENVPQKFLDKYFTVKKDKNDNKKFYLKSKIKKSVKFEKKDLINDKFNKNWDLIACRNFFIYLTKKMKSRIMKKFMKVLKPEGYLLVGNTEFIFNPQKYNLRKIDQSFYQKVE